MRDNVTKLGQVLFAAAAATLPAWTATWTGATIDLQAQPEYNAATLYIITGTWTDGTHTLVIQEAPDNGAGAPGTWTAVAASDLSKVQSSPTATVLYPPAFSAAGSQPTVISSAANAVNQRIGYLGGYPGGSQTPTRFLRVVGTVAGATTGARYLPVWILGEPRVFPAAV